MNSTYRSKRHTLSSPLSQKTSEGTLNTLKKKEALEILSSESSPIVRVNLNRERGNTSSPKVGSKGAKTLAKALNTNTTVQNLNIKGNSIGLKGAKDLSDVLNTNQSLSLVELDIGENNIKDEGLKLLTVSLTNNTSLRVLHLDSNGITKRGAIYIDQIIKEKTSITDLTISGNKLGKAGMQTIVEALETTKTLEHLGISRISLGTKGVPFLVKALNVNESITILDISGNNLKDDGITSLLEALKKNQSITKLNISDNHITRKSAETLSRVLFKENKTLRFPDLSDNNLGKKGAPFIGEGLKENHSIMTLKLSNNSFGSTGAINIFDAMPVNQCLSFLDLSKNRIKDKVSKSLDRAIRRNQSMRTLVLKSNQLSKAEFGDSLSSNQSLTALYLSGNPIKTILAKEIATALRKNNSLVILELKSCSDIKVEGRDLLYTAYQESVILASIWLNNDFFAKKQINHMGLRKFPVTFLQMNHLKIINLNDNAISELPYRIGELQSLRELRLANNRLQSLPYSLASLQLKVLDVSGNPLVTPPKEIVRKGRKEILGYLKDLAEGSEPCYRTKLMIVGQENVGKTTLLQRLQNRKHKTKKGQKDNFATISISTDGIDIEEWQLNVNFKTPEGKVKKQPVNFSVWDFAGQELYYTSHQFFMSERSIYVVVFDLRKPEENSRVEYWLQSIQARAKTAPIIVLGTHADDPICTTEYLQDYIAKMHVKYQDRFPNIKKFLVCDATQDVKQVIITIKEIISLQKHMGEPMPLTYLELEKVIKEETKTRKENSRPPIVTWKKFQKFGVIANISDESTLLRAAKFFHDMGTIVYFDDKKTGLRDLVILDPQFITDLLSSVITTKHRFVKDGVLLHKDLEHIWRDNSLFPKELHASFLAMMEKFEISLNLDSDARARVMDEIDPAGRSLIPCMLPEEEPDLEGKNFWRRYDPTRKELHRIYHLEFIPHGLFSRLMIRMIRYTDKVHIFWKNGVVMSKGNESILLRIHPLKRNLVIIVRSQEPVATGRVIVETVTNLIQNWFHIEVTESVPCSDCIKKQKEEPHLFSVRQCTSAIAKGQITVTCEIDKVPVSLDEIIPDIALSDVDLPRVDFEREVKLGKELGKGAFGQIFEGTWNSNSYAIKKLILDGLQEDSNEVLDIFHEFRREVWLMSKLTHPCVVNLKGYSFSPFAMIMEKIPEGQLYNFLHNEKNNLNWNLRIKIALDIAQGMQVLHGFNPPLVHRDLKSPNILLQSTNENAQVVAKVSDFGTAMHLYIGAFKEKASDRTVALPTWLAPEVVAEDEYTEKSDVYAYGIILWELITRRHPFDEYSWMAELEEAIIDGKRPPIPLECPTVWSNLIKRCWDGDYEKRPSFLEILQYLTKTVLPAISPHFKPVLHFDLSKKKARQSRKIMQDHERKQSEALEIKRLMEFVDKRTQEKKIKEQEEMELEIQKEREQVNREQPSEEASDSDENSNQN